MNLLDLLIDKHDSFSFYYILPVSSPARHALTETTMAVYIATSAIVLAMLCRDLKPSNCDL